MFAETGGELITQIGMGGIFALLVIREVLTFVKGKSSRANGDMAVSRSEFETHKKQVQTTNSCMQIVKRIDGRFDDIEKRDEDRSKYQDQRFNAIDVSINDLKGMVRELK